MDAETLRWGAGLGLALIGTLVLFILQGVSAELRELRRSQSAMLIQMERRMALVITTLYALQVELHPDAREIITHAMDVLVKGVSDV